MLTILVNFAAWILLALPLGVVVGRILRANQPPVAPQTDARRRFVGRAA
jgi:hypothetical protein